MSFRAEHPKAMTTALLAAGVYCSRCNTVLALAALDGQPVCSLCLFGATKEKDLAWILRKTRPLPVLAGMAKVRPDETPVRQIEGVA